MLVKTLLCEKLGIFDETYRLYAEENDFEERARALNTIMQHYSASSYQFSENQMQNVTIIKVEIESMTGKKSGY